MSRLRSLLLSCLCFSVACDADEGPLVDEFFELMPGGPLGKEDSAFATGLPVAPYHDTMAWEVENQWEDTNTPAARAAGLAWGEDSGLNWDEKYARWVGSLEAIPGELSASVPTTVRLTTPFGRSLPAPKLDCADTAIMLRLSFAAWYRLPFFVSMQDGSTTVYFGHFGIRTRNGRWGNAPAFAQRYEDFSDLSPQEAAQSWPRDEALRKAKTTADGSDSQPFDFLEAGALTGAYLDELHLNKRAAWLIRYTMIYAGSMHLADSRNTFNIEAAALRPGDVMLWRTSSIGTGHTMVTVRVDDVGAGHKEAQSIFGNLPPSQPKWDDATRTRINYTKAKGGGTDGTTDYAPFNGGLKRFRVAKPKGGVWVNTWMAADEASWINDTDHDALHERVDELATLLTEPSPEVLRQALLDTITSKREHLHSYPASCAARRDREDAFEKLYQLQAEHAGESKADVDAQWRVFEDYVFAELDYQQAKTCCWNSSTGRMFETIMSYNEELRAKAEAEGTCVEPTVFKAVDGDYAVFREHDPEGWVAWSADEACPWQDVQQDVEAEHAWTPWCERSAADDGGGEPPPAAGNSCVGRCGGPSDDGTCYCDDLCEANGDCCPDYGAVCG